MPKVGFVSLGCPKNLVDSEVMMGILARAGYEITPRAGEADVLVVNTCSFIAPAQQESVQSILEMAEYKKFGRAQKLIVAGCMVERYRNEIREQIPEVDAVIGTGEVEKILEACEGELRNADAECRASAAHLSLSRSYAAHSRHAAPHRLHQDQRRLRPSLHVLRDPAASRKIPQPPIRIRGARSGKSRRRGRARNFADRPGHHLLRRRPGPARRPGRRCSNAWRKSKTCIGFASSIAIRIASRRACSKRSPRIRAWRNISTCRCSTPAAACLARMKRGSNGDAFLKMLEKARKPFPAFRFALRSSSASPAKPKRIFANCAISCAPRNSTGWASSPTPTRTSRKASRYDGQGRRGERSRAAATR